MLDEFLKETKGNMDKVIDSLKKGLTTIRTGRASPGMLDGVRVDYYGSPTPLNQIATVSAQDARLLVVKPHDRKSLNPNNDGENIRLAIPPLSTDRRKEFVKMAKVKGEDAKVALRNVRRDANEFIKAKTGEGALTQDDEKRGLKGVQDATDQYVKNIDQVLSGKEKEIMEV